MKELADCRLYAFIDTAWLRGRDAAGVARELCDGGADLIQLRAKDLAPGDVRQIAEKVLPIVRAAGAGLVINDHWQVAVDAGADFCHLGQEDFFDSGRRHVSELKLAPASPRIGLSTHAAEQASRAIAAGADYLAVGPVFATGTKPEAMPVTLDYVRWAARHIDVPWFAIGGITLENLDEVLGAGATRVCVVSAILNSKDISQTCHRFKLRLSSAR